MASTLVWGTVSVSTDLVWGLGSFLGDWGLEEFIGSFLGEEGRDDSLRGDVGLILPAKNDIFHSSVHKRMLNKTSSPNVRIHFFVWLNQTSSKQTEHTHFLRTQTYWPVPGSQLVRMTRKWKAREMWARDLNFAYPAISDHGKGQKPTDRLGQNEKYLHWKAKKLYTNRICIVNGNVMQRSLYRDCLLKYTSFMF